MIYFIRDRHAKLLAVVVQPDGRERKGVTFVTPSDLPHQLAYIQHPTGHEIAPHTHRPIPRIVPSCSTQEVLIVLRGAIRVTIFDMDRERVDAVTIRSGDSILLVAGGHGIEVLEAVEMYEVKQGPYVPGDKEQYDV